MATFNIIFNIIIRSMICFDMKFITVVGIVLLLPLIHYITKIARLEEMTNMVIQSSKFLTKDI